MYIYILKKHAQGDPKTPYPMKTLSVGTVTVVEGTSVLTGSLLDSFRLAGHLERNLLLGEGRAFSFVCLSVGGVSCEEHLCAFPEQMNLLRLSELMERLLQLVPKTPRRKTLNNV